MSDCVFRAVYEHPDHFEPAAPSRVSLRQANEDAAQLPTIPGSKVLVAKYRVDSDGLQYWEADYELGKTEPFVTAHA